MGAADHLGAYAEGWTTGNAEKIVSSLASNYTLDDPNSGVTSKQDFADYLARMKDMVSSLCGGSLPEPFMELSEVVTQETDGLLTAWCCWAIPGTSLKGAGLIKVGSDGVQSEVLTYYTRLPD